MKFHRFVLSLMVPLAFSLVGAGEAAATGACVYVKQEALQCVEATSTRACSSKSPSGEFHMGTTCKSIGYGKTWGLAKPPAPPAKGSFEGASYTERELPKIESPLQKRRM